jgi:hypothetical protein
MQCYEGIRQAQEVVQDIRKLRTQWKEAREKTKEESDRKTIANLEDKAAALEGIERGRRERRSGARGEPTLGRAKEEMLRLLELLQGADAAPTTQAVTACREAQERLAKLLEDWKKLKSEASSIEPKE